jgi:hypothetical protein
MSKISYFFSKNYTALLVLAISMPVYATTVAPTASFWDCGEFIASATFLQVPHPPGAPLYLLLGRIFSLFAPTPSLVALFINMLSVTASAFTVFFVYKILIILFQIIKIDPYAGKKGCTEVASATGALLFAFTDTFWTSATEAEIYSLSLYFSVVTLWAFLSWFTSLHNDPRWFFLGVFLLGLSIGVHLLNLLLVPVFVLLMGWKHWGTHLTVTVKSLLSGFLLLGILFWGVVSNGLWPAMKMELFFVNSLGLPKHTGLAVWIIALVVIHISGIFYSHHRNRIVHFAFVTSTLFLFGFSSYALVLLRAEANPPVNMNDPDNVFSLTDYINRKQYGNRPLLYGPHAGAKPDKWQPVSQYYYDREKKNYKQANSDTQIQFRENDYVWFPRIYSRRPEHLRGYEWWTGIDPSLKKPDFTHQINFFLRYQMGHSYLRYLMWNFVGRQNDQQGHGDIFSGNFATGINYIDRHFLGSRDYPTARELYNPAANHYFGLPLILALIGFLFLLRRGAGRKKVLLLIGLLFLMTGPAIVFYLNQPPFEPRERDYVFLASFMAMALLGGIGVFALLRKVFIHSGSMITGLLASLLLFLAGPGLLFSINLNDHNRSENYLPRDLAVSQLRSCPQNAVLFTYGDNDTYPLWYAQQVEHIRPDIRIINLGLLNAPWFVYQARLSEPGSAGLKMTLPQKFYQLNSIEFFDVSLATSVSREGVKVLENFLNKRDTNNNEDQSLDAMIHPVWNISLPENQSIDWNISARYLAPGTLAMADIIASNSHQRPICFTRNVDESALQGLENNLVSTGLLWEIGAGNHEKNNNTELFHEYGIFMDSISIGRKAQAWRHHTSQQALSASGYRQLSLNLARKLLNAEQQQKAADVLNKSLVEWPYSPHIKQAEMLELANLLLACGEKNKAAQLVRNISTVNMQNVFFYYYSGFATEHIQHEFCGLFREIRNLARKMELNDLLLEIEVKLKGLCDF